MEGVTLQDKSKDVLQCDASNYSKDIRGVQVYCHINQCEAPATGGPFL